MWLLDARADAEKVWYQEIWATTKESGDVVDYNINEEITKDTSNIINSNNQTTTWLATVIPWINAPRLIENTSIYSNTVDAVWWCSIKWSVDFRAPEEVSWRIRNWTIESQYWNLDYKNKVTSDVLRNWFEMPKTWWYQITIHYPYRWWSYVNTSLRIAKWWLWNDVHIIDHNAYNDSWYVTETITYQFTAWDVIYAYLEVHWLADWNLLTSRVTLDIVKL